MPGFEFEWNDDPEGAERRGRWLAEHPKSFLAAQIAVGSVDQALLSMIAVKHAHPGGTALLRHWLLVDEVHALDRSMEQRSVTLLDSHLQAGGRACCFLQRWAQACGRSCLAQRRRVRVPVSRLRIRR